MILLLGLRGLLGSHLCKQFPEVTGISSLECDITKADHVRQLLDVYEPTVVINAAGETRNTKRMFDVNVKGAQNVSAITGEYGIRLVHISTNCVFSGKTGYYTESSEPDIVEIDKYGFTKLLGEMPYNANQLTVRTSFVGWPDEKGNSLLSWFMQQEQPISGYTQAIWNGLTAWELSKWIVKLASLSLKGTIHLGMKECISKYTLLSLVNQVYEAKKEIVPDYHIFENKVLLSARQTYTFPTFIEQLEEMKEAWKI